MAHNLRASILLSLFTLTACGPVIADDLAPLPSLTSDDTSAASGSASSGSTGGDSTGGGSGGDSTGVGSTGAEGNDSTGEAPAPAPAPACFGAPCSDEIPCGDGLVCLVHPYGGPAVCGLADCIPGEYCEGDEYACSKHTPQGDCIADNSGHGWCHPRACKDGWYCETGECDAGLCY